MSDNNNITRHSIQIENLSFSYESKPVLQNLNLTLPLGKISVLTGPSGIGKTTLLRLIAGLEKPDSGTIRISEKSEERIAMLFQESRLLPWMTAEENIRFVLSKEKSVEEWLKAVELEDEGSKYPSELSGGMQQRLSLARFLAYAKDCDLLLLDEPFQGLDLPLHERMAQLIRQESAGKTVILISHDPEDVKRLDGCEVKI